MKGVRHVDSSKEMPSFQQNSPAKATSLIFDEGVFQTKSIPLTKRSS